LSHTGRPAEPDKRTLRREFLTVRNRLTADDVQSSATALAGRALELPELAHAGTVAAYVSVGSEPGTLALLDALRARGRTPWSASNTAERWPSSSPAASASARTP